MLPVMAPEKYVVIKIVRRKLLERYEVQLAENPQLEILEDPLQEIAVMQSLFGQLPLPLISSIIPDIIYQIDCCITDDDIGDIYSIMPFYSLGDLHDQITQRGAMTAPAARNMVTQVLNGLELLQSNGIGHRDLSLENVVMEVVPNTSNSFKFVIIDFGMAVKCPLLPDAVPPYTMDSYQHVPHVDIGKQGYKAPEVYFFKPDYSAVINPMRADMWALGIMLLFALSGASPTVALLNFVGISICILYLVHVCMYCPCHNNKDSPLFFLLNNTLLSFLVHILIQKSGLSFYYCDINNRNLYLDF